VLPGWLRVVGQVLPLTPRAGAATPITTALGKGFAELWGEMLILLGADGGAAATGAAGLPPGDPDRAHRWQFVALLKANPFWEIRDCLRHRNLTMWQEGTRNL